MTTRGVLKRFRDLVYLFRSRKQFARFLRESNRPDYVVRKSGAWSHADIQRLAGWVAGTPGDFAEIGVYKGDAFRKVVAEASAQGKTAHAFDSFEGMDTPGPEDGDEYPKGKLDVGGAGRFLQIMKEHGLDEEAFRIWAGFIPACFEEVGDAIRFSFVILDVDHYQPTVDALAWVWPRLNRGGILALDDFIPTHDRLATKAIKEFLRKHGDYDIRDYFNHQLILAKL